MMGYEPWGIPYAFPETSIPAAEDHVKNLQKIQEEAIACHNLAMQCMADRTFTRKFEPWKPGDKVWLSGSHLLTHFPSWKLTPKKYGPFPVEATLSPITFRLWLPNSWRIHPVFHASELSSYCETEIHSPNYPEPLPDVINGEEEYKIEAILAHKGNIKGRHYSKNSITLEFTVSCTYILYSKTSVQYLEFTVSCTKSKTVNSATSPKIV
jgi:hypothetical protein